MDIKGEKGNEISGVPVREYLTAINFRGAGNKIILAGNVGLLKVTINFEGDNGTLIVGQGAVLRGKIRVDESSTIVIGDGTRFNKPCQFLTGEGRSIIIGRGCLLANVSIRTSDQHSIFDLETRNRINPAADVVIEDHVWIAEEVSIYKGVRIGSGSIVGAHAVVVKDLPRNSLCVGIPAKPVKSNVAWHAKLIEKLPDDVFQ